MIETHSPWPDEEEPQERDAAEWLVELDEAVQAVHLLLTAKIAKAMLMISRMLRVRARSTACRLEAQRHARQGPRARQIAVDRTTAIDLVAAGETPPVRIPAFASRIHVLAANSAGTDLNFTAGNFLIFLGGPLTGDRQLASVRLDQYLNAIGEGIVIPWQAKYTTIFNLFGRS